MPLRASWMSLTRPLGRVRIALPARVTCSLLPRGARTALEGRVVGPAGSDAAAPVRTCAACVVPASCGCRVRARSGDVRAGGRGMGAVGGGPVGSRRAGGCSVRCARLWRLRQLFTAGLAGADFAGAFFSSAAALAMPVAPSSPATITAAEQCLIVLEKSRIVIPVPHSCSRPAFHSDAQTLYSTLLTFPLVRVTFISL